MVIKNEKNPKQKIQYFTLKWTQNSESVRKATHKIPACKEHINKSISKLRSFSLAPAKMSALDARHRRERMLMLFIAQGWLPLPLYLRSSRSLTYSCSQRLSQAEDGLPRAVLEALGFALGKWTEICSLFPKASITNCLRQGQPPAKLLPSWLPVLGPLGATGQQFAGAHPPSPPYQLWDWPTAHAKHHQEPTLQKQQHKTWWNIGGKKHKQLPKLAGA